MPHCYTALEELIYTFGGPWLFCLLLIGLLILLALVLSVARMKFVGVDELPGPAPTQHGSQIDHSFPFLESLNEVHCQLLARSNWMKFSFYLSSPFLICLLTRIGNVWLLFRSWRQTELRRAKVMCTECILSV